MAVYWFSLPTDWKLEDVQAVLNVVITLLSALGIFTLVRCCWIRAAGRLVQDHKVLLPSLLVLNTPGEALDVLNLMRSKIFSIRFATVLVQCVVVVCLSSTAILSGPIARYSTRKALIVVKQDVPGLLASRNFNGMSFANVEWNLTYTRLEDAGFPKDQLLDYLPDNSIDWVFEPAQWNNSWSLECKRTPKTPVELYDSGNCRQLTSEIPNLERIFNVSKWDPVTSKWDGYYSSLDVNKDILLFVHGVNKWDYVETFNTSRSMSMLLASIHLHDVPRNQNLTDGCSFRQGDIGKSSYTKIECEIRRQETVEDALDVAYPDIHNDTYANVPAAYRAFYQSRFTQQATSDTNISVISPDELIRFYQAYNIAKDLQYRQPITRRLSVSVQVVQLSVIFLAIAVMIGLLILLGLIRYGIFAILHRPIMTNTPQSKLDWMIQSIQTEDHHPFSDAVTTSIGQSVMPSPATRSSGSLSIEAKKRKKDEFETATYSEGRAVARLATGSPTIILDQAPSPSPRSNNGYAGGRSGRLTEVIHDDKNADMTSRYLLDGDFDTRAR